VALLMNSNRMPAEWEARKNGYVRQLPGGANPLRVALINNMPDAALEDTELQFFDLLESASEGIPVEVRLFSLPGLQRGERALSHLDRFYSSTEDLSGQSFDGAIITGTEPRQPDLRNEPYWGSLVNLFEWAERNTTSTILSCLAAHAGVLYSDGIQRRPLGEKKFGVFEYQRLDDHELLSGVGDSVRFPHSRWNEVPAETLTACGYTILTHSDAGVDMFLKQKRSSLFLHFQGHPEYGASTLLKEYRRDIKRFLKRERATYPAMPCGYFDRDSAELVAKFRDRVSQEPRQEQIESFPEAALINKLQRSWQSSAVRVYQNWLSHVAAKKTERTSVIALAKAG
jgi:homoserine O-succinyltransferase/O-acetyltransferase